MPSPFGFIGEVRELAETLENMNDGLEEKLDTIIYRLEDIIDLLEQKLGLEG